MNTAIHIDKAKIKYGPDMLAIILKMGQVEQDTIEIDVEVLRKIESDLDKTKPGWRTPPKKPLRKKTTGLGDVVYLILHPFVILLDRIAGTKWQDCKTCADRRRRMNRWWHVWRGKARNALNGIFKSNSRA